MNLGVIFITGLTVGGLTCLAVQGGLLASVITSREEENLNGKGLGKHALFATAAFLLSKLIAYTILGFILGFFGGVISINSQVQTLMQLFAGIYMVAVAFNLLNIHPIFRYVIIQPPRFLTRLVRSQSKSKDIFAPALLGAMTIFIPCGTTIAMETLAISTATGLGGALVLMAFILGTMPLFFGIGVITSFMGEKFKSRFLKLAAVAVIYLGLTSINASLVAFGSPLTWQSFKENFPIKVTFNQEESAPTIIDVDFNQNPVIDVTGNGYNPNYIKVKKGEKVTLTLRSRDAYSCAAAFRIPSLSISKNLTPNDTQIISFTPTSTGKIQFNCAMGMYRGIIEVL